MICELYKRFDGKFGRSKQLLGNKNAHMCQILLSNRHVSRSENLGGRAVRGGAKIWGGAPWARRANFVKKPPLIDNVTYLELNCFNASMWVSCSLSDPKKSQCSDWFFQIHQMCVNKHKYENHIKFEVSLHFLPIWPTVGRTHHLPPRLRHACLTSFVLQFVA